MFEKFVKIGKILSVCWGFYSLVGVCQDSYIEKQSCGKGPGRSDKIGEIKRAIQSSYKKGQICLKKFAVKDLWPHYLQIPAETFQIRCQMEHRHWPMKDEEGLVTLYEGAFYDLEALMFHQSLHFHPKLKRHLDATHDYPDDNHIRQFVSMGDYLSQKKINLANPSFPVRTYPNRVYDRIHACTDLCFDRQDVSREQCLVCTQGSLKANKESVCQQFPPYRILHAKAALDELKKKCHGKFSVDWVQGVEMFHRQSLNYTLFSSFEDYLSFLKLIAKKSKALELSECFDRGLEEISLRYEDYFAGRSEDEKMSSPFYVDLLFVKMKLTHEKLQGYCRKAHVVKRAGDFCLMNRDRINWVNPHCDLFQSKVLTKMITSSDSKKVSFHYQNWRKLRLESQGLLDRLGRPIRSREVADIPLNYMDICRPVRNEGYRPWFEFSRS